MAPTKEGACEARIANLKAKLDKAEGEVTYWKDQAQNWERGYGQVCAEKVELSDRSYAWETEHYHIMEEVQNLRENAVRDEAGMQEMREEIALLKREVDQLHLSNAATIKAQAQRNHWIAINELEVRDSLSLQINRLMKEIDTDNSIIHFKNEAIESQKKIIESKNKIIESNTQTISSMQKILETNSTTILAQADEILYAQSSLQALQLHKSKELTRLRTRVSRHQEERKIYMSCYEVGRLCREIKINSHNLIPKGTDEQSWRKARMCLCHEHQGRPLADATAMLFTSKLKFREPTEDEHVHFDYCYCVTPAIAFNNYTFKKFQFLMRAHSDFQFYKSEESTREEAADNFINAAKDFIHKIWPDEIYKSDADIEADEYALEEYQLLVKRHAAAIDRHNAMNNERIRDTLGIELSFDLMDIVKNPVD